jgi:GNAT superfamily N-acetyltransferase
MPLFAGYTGDTEQSQQVHVYLTQMFDARTMRPAWCFVAFDDDDRLVGRVAFWTLPGLEYPLDIVLFDVDWHESGHVTGRLLILHVLELARELGATTIGYALDEPPSAPHYHHNLEERLALLYELGFELARATYRFESPENLPSAPVSQPHYWSISEVGEEKFLDAIARVSEGTLDQRITADRARLGAEGQAREMLDELLLMEHEPEWWRLAYTPAGELVGLIMPASNFLFGIVGYIGVVPEQRGHGYVHALLAETTALLHAAGYARIRADTDAGNEPMANAFRRASWQQFATRRELSTELTMPESWRLHTGCRW